MKKQLFILCALICSATIAFGQFSEFRNDIDSVDNLKLGSKGSSIRLGGRISAFYEVRVLKPGNDNYRHNGFAFKDADLDLLGKSHGFVYEAQLSILDLVKAASNGNTGSLTTQGGTNASPNPYNTGIKAMYVAYEGDKFPIHVKLGYDKLPYSQGSMNDAYTTPFWSHNNLFGGDYYSRRDLGITLYKSFWRKRFHAYAGIYSGLGESVFEYGNDASGKPEYVGCIDFGFPTPLKYNAIDEAVLPVPVFRVGINARYTDKTQPAGHTLAEDVPDAPGAYGLRLVDGRKLVYGGDAMFAYKGFSALFETDIIRVKPASSSDALYVATTAAFNKGVVNAGGFSGNINYNWNRIHSVFSASYEQLNSNDLVAGDQEWLYFAYAYKLHGFNSVFKIEYYKPLQEDVNQNALKYSQLVRVGYQLVF